MRGYLVAGLLAALAGEGLADELGFDAYLKPGTPQVGGVKHLCLIYHGSKKRVSWTAEALMPYVAEVDEAWQPQSWLFDSFLLIEFATDRGTSLILHFHADFFRLAGVDDAFPQNLF